jgi:imidazolonepropionase-like amidohydrolase
MRTVLTNVRIIDGTGRPPFVSAFLAIEGGLIGAVGRASEFFPQEGDIVHELDGLTVLPGLFDTHVHIYASGSVERLSETPPENMDGLEQLQGASHLRAHIEAGFTTVRDVGSVNGSMWALRHAVRQELIPGPRLVASGKCLTVTGGHGTEYGVDMAWECDDAGDLVKAVRRQQHEGCDFVKVIASRRLPTGGRQSGRRFGLAPWPVEDLQAAVEEAHALGLKVAAHVSGGPAPMQVAVAAGVDSLEHGWGVDDATLEKMAGAGVFLVPTLAVLSRKEALEREERSPWPPEISTIFGSLEERLAECGRAHALGVPIAAGTDAGNPGVLHGEGAQELELLVQAGLSPMEAIVAATGNAARLCGLETETGCVEPGKAADLLVLDGDPLEDITLLQDGDRIRTVLRAGRVVAGALKGGTF